MDRPALIGSIEANTRMDFARSGGPGGQNVNKVNSKVIARIELSSLLGLSEAELALAKERLANRIVEDGSGGAILLVIVDEERDQIRNRAIALSRIEQLLTAASAIPKTRRPTKPGRAARERRLDSKHKRSTIKRGRGSGSPGSDD